MSLDVVVGSAIATLSVVIGFLGLRYQVRKDTREGEERQGAAVREQIRDATEPLIRQLEIKDQRIWDLEAELRQERRHD